MAVSVADLVTRYPEFTDTPSTMVQACIDDAEVSVDRTVYGNKADMAIKAFAAHLIAINPLGEMARLDKKGEKTTYLLQFERAKRSVAAGFRVI